MQSFDSKKPAFLTTAHVHISLVQGLSGSAPLTFCGSFFMGGWGGHCPIIRSGRWGTACLGSTHEIPGYPPLRPSHDDHKCLQALTCALGGKREGIQNCPWWRTTYLVYGVCMNEIRRIQDPRWKCIPYWDFFFPCLLVCLFSSNLLGPKSYPRYFFLHLHGLTTYFQMCHSYRVAASG